jgi:predicted metal-dependent hydrolase
MKLTKSIIKSYYLDNNSNYFNNELPTKNIAFAIDHSIHNVAGFVRQTKNKYKIFVSDMFLWDKEELSDIITHEMIHLKLSMIGKNDFSNHGNNFKAECARIYQERKRVIPLDGSHILKTHKCKELLLKEKNRKHNVFLIMLNWLINKIC